MSSRTRPQRERVERTTAGTVDEAVRGAVLERTHDLVAATDPDGTIVFASPSWSTLGWDPEHLPGTPLLELVHPDDAAAAAAAIAEVVAGADLDAVTVRLRRSDGSWSWVDATATAILAEDGSVRLLLGTARDVTEREELGSRLRDLDAVYRFAAAVADAGSLDAVFGEAIDALLEATAADRAAVLLADEDGVLRFRAGSGLSDGYRAATDGHSPWPPGTTDPEPVLVADVVGAGFEPELERVVREEGIAALAFVPLVHGGRLVGKFMLYHDAPHEWTPREVLLCRTIASHLASVTVRAQAQEQLQASREQLAAILRTVDESITVQNPSGLLEYANEAAARQLGFETVDELLATPSAEVVDRYELLDEDGGPLAREDLPGRRALAGTGGSRVVRYRVRATGEERWSVVRANPVPGPDGTPALAVSVTHDITPEKQAEQREREARALLESVFRTAPTGLAFWDTELRYVRVNEALAEMKDLSAEDMLGRTFFEVFPALEEQLAPRFAEVLEHGRTVLGIEVRGETAARPGVEREWLLNLFPVRDDGGGLLGVGGVVAEVTEQRAAQAAADDARARLELLLDATERLTETLDHSEMLRRVPGLVVPRIADVCHVYLAREDGAQLVRVAHEHVDPELGALLESIDPVYATAGKRVPVVDVFRTGEPIHAATVGRSRKRFARDPAEEEKLDRIGTRSLIVLPLAAAGRRFGVVAISSAQAGRHDEADFELAVELARRISLALDAVALHRRAQDSLAQLQAVLAQLPLGVVIADAATGRLVVRNEAVEQIWQREVPPGQPLSEDAGGGASSPLGRALSTGEIAIGERHDFVRTDGTRGTIEINAAPVRDPEGDIVAGVAIFTDVTDRRRAEERVRFLAAAGELLSGSLDAEETLRAVAVLAVPSFAGYLVVDLLGEDDQLRCVAAVHSDPARTELVRAMRDRYPPVVATHPVQVALRSGEAVLLADLQEHVDTMAQDQRHARAIRRIGNTSGIVVPLVARGRTLGTISLGSLPPQPDFDAEDVAVAVELARRASLALDNARLYAEAQRRAHAAEALEFVDDGVFLVDGGGIVRLLNPAAAASFGLPAEQAVGAEISELVPEWESLRERIPIASEPLARRSRAQTLPVELQGEERWLSLSAVRFPGGTVYAFRDLTEERAIEQMKSDFVSTVSHELRTPLAAIYGAALTLRRDDVALEESQRDGLLEVIAGEADRLARIVNDILWASRVDSGGMSVAIERCDAASLALQVADALRARLPAGLVLEVVAGAGLPPVAADPDKLRQVLVNLLDNAAKYSPDGGRVELEVTRSGNRIRFRIRDEGLGIPPAEQDRIFEKFFRLDPNLTRGVGGTGLGLYITRELVNRMDGRVWLDSDGRTGSTFFVELPTA
jgi:PAS domain S-box-containing protein